MLKNKILRIIVRAVLKSVISALEEKKQALGLNDFEDTALKALLVVYDIL